MNPPQVQRNGGFTLIEVVLALTIFALMGTVLYGAFAIGHRAIDKTEVHFERNQKMRSFVDLIGSYIRSSYPYRISPQDPRLYFSGDPEELSFVSAYSLAMGGRGMAKVRLAWEETGGGEGVVELEEAVPVRLEDDTGESGQRNSIVVEERVKKFKLAYLDPQSNDERWEERWDAAEKKILPRAVQLSYETRTGREVRWVFPVMMIVLAQ